MLRAAILILGRASGGVKLLSFHENWLILSLFWLDYEPRCRVLRLRKEHISFNKSRDPKNKKKLSYTDVPNPMISPTEIFLYSVYN